MAYTGIEYLIYDLVRTLANIANLERVTTTFDIYLKEKILANSSKHTHFLCKYLINLTV
mgnify:CR=1 FL=1